MSERYVIGQDFNTKDWFVYDNETDKNVCWCDTEEKAKGYVKVVDCVNNICNYLLKENISVGGVQFSDIKTFDVKHKLVFKKTSESIFDIGIGNINSYVNIGYVDLNTKDAKELITIGKYLGSFSGAFCIVDGVVKVSLY